MPSSFALGPHFETLLQDLVSSGRYNNASEVVRAGLRLLEDRESDLRARRTELEASFAAALADVEAGNGLSAEEIRAHFNRRHEELLRKRSAAE